MPMDNDDKDSPEPGTVNEARTKCCCRWCEEAMDFDPSWTHDQYCPKCEESMFCYCCDTCSSYTCNYPNILSFPDQPCGECCKTPQEIQAEEKREEGLKKERERVKRGFEYRQRVEDGIHQNAIMHTYQSLMEPDMGARMRAIRNPKDCADALRMFDDTFELLRPLLVEEIEKRNLKADQLLTPDWCQRRLSFFERSWLEENEESLRTGVTPDHTGGVYFSLDSQLSIHLRKVREGHAECFGTFPCCPALKIKVTRTQQQDGKKDQKAVQVTWDPDPERGTDRREIYQKDGNRKLTLGEFLLWTARMGSEGGPYDCFNPKYVIPFKSVRDPEPNAYVPINWVGRPLSWQTEEDNGFPHFQKMWMHVDPRVVNWSGQLVLDNILYSFSEQNMRRCCVCYGLPTSGRAQDLLDCECGNRLYCSQEHKDEYMEIHKFDKTLKHPSVARTCLECGEERPNLSQCSQCKNAYFCNQECQQEAWNTFDSGAAHKKYCRAKWSRSGHPSLDNMRAQTNKMAAIDVSPAMTTTS